jgi:flap endonuclease-1
MGVAIRDILADYRYPVDWDSLKGVAAIDAHNALYQFLSIIRQPDGTPLMDHEGRVTSHLSGLFFRSTNFLEKGIRPVYIFDGPPPDFKMETLQERRAIREEAGVRWQEALKRGDREEAYRQARSASRIDASVISTSKELLGHMGIPFLDAPSEGEAQAAYMVQQKEVSYAVSQDYDALLFGASVLVRNLTIRGKRKLRGRTISVKPERLILNDILAALEITREELIEIGILIGTDFNPGIRGIGGKTALKLVRQDMFSETMQDKQPDFDPDPVKAFFLSPPFISDYHLAWSGPDEEGIVEMLCEKFDFSKERVMGALEKMSVKAGQKTLDKWFS